MPFPTELDGSAFRQLTRAISGTDRDLGRLALASWELIGFALGKAFNNPAFIADLAQADPVTAAIVTEIATANGDRLKQLLEQYGPLVLNLLLKLLLK